MRRTYQGRTSKSNQKFEILGRPEVLVQVPLPMAELWEELQAELEQMTGQAGLQIIGAMLEDEVRRRVGPPHRPDLAAGAVRWGRQPGYVIFGGQKIPLQRPRVRTREGQEVPLETYQRLQREGRRQRRGRASCEGSAGGGGFRVPATPVEKVSPSSAGLVAA